MTELSPQTQAVLNAWESEWSKGSFYHEERSVAAALRAVADQVVPWKPEPTEESIGPTIDFGYAWALFSKANDVRQELLAIAAELEGGE
jgi:hypothetical protein